MDAEINKCPHCGKQMEYNDLLSIYECNNPKCWTKRLSKENISKVMDSLSVVPGAHSLYSSSGSPLLITKSAHILSRNIKKLINNRLK